MWGPEKIHAIGPENRLINDEYSSINKTKVSERVRPRSEVRVNLGCEARPALRNAETEFNREKRIH